MKHQHKSTTSSTSYWLVRQNHQDADWVKRSMKHDFETQWAVNCYSSQTWQEIELIRDQTDDHKHSRRDK